MYAIVFCRTRRDTQNVADWLVRDGYTVDAIHGDLTQAQRDRVMRKFRDRRLQILVATDVAARGLDVNDLTHVVNYNLPDELGSYTHRSGRTGRAGKSGVSVVIINMREKGKVRRIEKIIGKTFAWRDVPSGDAICRARLRHLAERVKAVNVNDAQIAPFLPDVAEALEGMDREEMARRFVSLELNSLLTYYHNTEDLSARPAPARSPRREPRARTDRPPRTKRKRSGPTQDSPGGVRMFINLGQFDGLTPARLMGMVNRTGGRDRPVGRIDIQHKHSFFVVGSKDAEAIARGLSSLEINRRRVQARRADAGRREPRFGRGKPHTSQGRKPHREVRGKGKSPAAGAPAKAKSRKKRKAGKTSR